MKSKTFKESTHLLLCTREEILLGKEKINKLPKPWFNSSDEKSLIEQQWLGNNRIDVLNIDGNDLRTLCGKEWVNGHIITSILQGIVAAVSDGTVLSYISIYIHH